MNFRTYQGFHQSNLKILGHKVKASTSERRTLSMNQFLGRGLKKGKVLAVNAVLTMSIKIEEQL